MLLYMFKIVVNENPQSLPSAHWECPKWVRGHITIRAFLIVRSESFSIILVLLIQSPG